MHILEISEFNKENIKLNLGVINYTEKRAKVGMCIWGLSQSGGDK